MFSRLGVAVTGTLLGGVESVPISEDAVVDILGWVIFGEEGRQDGDEMGQERRREIRKERRRGRGEDAAVSVGRSEVYDIKNELEADCAP
jgi:hypothetical protein